MKKKSFIRKLLLATCSAFVMTNVNAQTNVIKNAFVNISETNGQSTATFTILLGDTNSVGQIKTNLGSMRDSSDLVNQQFFYDVTTGLPAGVSYERNGCKLTLSVTGFTSVSTYFGKVSVKNNSNIWSNYKFITNSSSANN